MARQRDVEVGQIWTAKVSGKLVRVRVDSIKVAENTYYTRKKTTYGLTNLNTGRTLGGRTAAFLRVKVIEPYSMVRSRP